MATVTYLTIDDFERLPPEQAKNHELVNGELVPEPGRTARHNLTLVEVIVLLESFVREHRLGQTILGQAFDFGGDALGPDVSFFGPAKSALVELDKRVQRFVPDLAIEIVSADDMFNSLVRKKERYRNCGTEEVWIVEPEAREVLIYSARGDRILREDAELTSELLPGFRMPVKRLFEAANGCTHPPAPVSGAAPKAPGPQNK